MMKNGVPLLMIRVFVSSIVVLMVCIWVGKLYGYEFLEMISLLIGQFADSINNVC